MTSKDRAEYLLKKVDEVVCGDINEQNTKDMALLITDEVIKALKASKGLDDLRTKFAIHHWQGVANNI